MYRRHYYRHAILFVNANLHATRYARRSTKVVEQTSKVVRTTTDSSQANGGDNADSDDEDDEDEENTMFKAIASALGGGDSEEGDKDAIAVGPKNVFGNKDKLDLAGLLNVLDGVVDTPDR